MMVKFGIPLFLENPPVQVKTVLVNIVYTYVFTYIYIYLHTYIYMYIYICCSIYHTLRTVFQKDRCACGIFVCVRMCVNFLWICHSYVRIIWRAFGTHFFGT